MWGFKKKSGLLFLTFFRSAATPEVGYVFKQFDISSAIIKQFVFNTNGIT